MMTARFFLASAVPALSAALLGMPFAWIWSIPAVRVNPSSHARAPVRACASAPVPRANLRSGSPARRATHTQVRLALPGSTHGRGRKRKARRERGVTRTEGTHLDAIEPAAAARASARLPWTRRRARAAAPCRATTLTLFRAAQAPEATSPRPTGSLFATSKFFRLCVRFFPGLTFWRVSNEPARLRTSVWTMVGRRCHRASPFARGAGRGPTPATGANLKPEKSNQTVSSAANGFSCGSRARPHINNAYGAAVRIMTGTLIPP